jgi:dTDP-4-dehydrorhamnose reductase
MQRVLVVGGTGMLGHKAARVLATDSSFEVHCSIRAPQPPSGVATAGVIYHPGVDLSTGTSILRSTLERVRPHIIVNAVGAIKQKRLDEALDETFFINGTLPHALTLLDPTARAKVVHFSTDCVFVGDRGGYRESDEPDSEDLYGRSKACGELRYGRHLTIRTSIIGFEIAGHLSLLSWLFRQRPGTPLRGFNRAIFSGLPTVTLSRTLRDILALHPEISGLYHVASRPIDKMDLLSRISTRFGLGHQFTPDPSVQIDRSLDDSRFRALSGTATPKWDELIEELHEDYVTGPYERIYHELRNQSQ